MEKRLGTVSIMLERHAAPVDEVNELLSEFGDEIIGRLGLPYPQRGVNIITLITDTSMERTSALTGKLGKLPGVQVRSLLAKAAGQGAVHEPADHHASDDHPADQRPDHLTDHDFDHPAGRRPDSGD